MMYSYIHYIKIIKVSGFFNLDEQGNLLLFSMLIQLLDKISICACPHAMVRKPKFLFSSMDI